MAKIGNFVAGPAGNIVWGRLPVGCALCWKGLKTVVFITGLCNVKCYYCPISFERRGRDITYVNERRFGKIRDLIMEIEISKSEGISITGGEPALRAARVLRVVEAVKREFGRGFHIHLYTSGVGLTGNILENWWSRGIDEIRFHVVSQKTLELVEKALELGSWDVGVEIPVLPGSETYIMRLIRILQDLKVKFINLNEMEITESNAENLLLRGFKLGDRSPTSVEGSHETALKVLKKCVEEGVTIGVHYCTARYKDAVQTRMRFLVRGNSVKSVFEETLSSGLLRKAVLKVGVKEAPEIISFLHDKRIMFDALKESRDVVELVVHPSNLRDLLSFAKISGKIALAYEYPIEPRMRVIEEVVW